MAGSKKKRSYKEIFMDELTKVSGGEQKLVGNISFREAARTAVTGLRDFGAESQEVRDGENP